MKKYALPLSLLTLLTSCITPVDRSWIIPVTIDPSDLYYTPEELESYSKRRRTTLDLMEEGFLILKSSDQYSNNRHEFRPNNYFFYLSGRNLPDSYLILEKNSGAPFILSHPSQSLMRQIYEGGALTWDQTIEQFRPDRLVTFHEAKSLLDSIMESGSMVYLDMENRELLEDLGLANLKKSPTVIRDAAAILDEMRVIKDAREVERLQKASNITARALTRAMEQCRAGRYEFEMESVIEGTFREYGAAMPGFSSIVASGKNTTILHYEPNNRMMEEGELLLLDIGAEYGYYTADISRTIPVNGEYSAEQRVIYQLVLDAQQAAIELMKPEQEWMEGQHAARRVIRDGLANLGLITDTSASWQTEFYCIHGISHYVGLDVHDVGNTGMGRKLEAGMVITVEPGIYFREDGLNQIGELYGNEADSSEIAAFIKAVGPTYQNYVNIGVRIEDDILVTREGNIILSRYAPREIEDIEMIMR